MLLFSCNFSLGVKKQLKKLFIFMINKSEYIIIIKSVDTIDSLIISFKNVSKSQPG